MSARYIYKEIMNHYNISANKLGKRLGTSHSNILIAIKRNAGLKVSTINKILNEFPEISKDWLYTGQGEMISGSTTILDDHILFYQMAIALAAMVQHASVVINDNHPAMRNAKSLLAKLMMPTNQMN